MDISLLGGLNDLEKQKLIQDNERGFLNGFIRKELRYVDARELQPVVRNVTSQREYFVPQRCEPQRTSLRASFLKAARNITGFLRKRFKGVIITVLAVIIITSVGQRVFQYVKENLSAEYESNRTLVDSEHPELVDVLKEFVNGPISDEEFKSAITKMMEKSIPISESFSKTLTTPDVFRTLPNAFQYERVVNAVTFLNDTLLKYQQSGMKEFFDYMTPSYSLNPTRSETITAGGKFLEKTTEHLNRTVEESTHWKHIVPHHATEDSKFREQTTWKHIVPHHATEDNEFQEQTTWKHIVPPHATEGSKFQEQTTWKHIVPPHATEGNEFQEETTWKHIVPPHATEDNEFQEETTWKHIVPPHATEDNEFQEETTWKHIVPPHATEDNEFQEETTWKHIVPPHATEDNEFQEETTWKHIVPPHATEDNEFQEETTWKHIVPDHGTGGSEFQEETTENLKTKDATVEHSRLRKCRRRF